MSSSRPSDASVDRPDPADLPEDDGSSAANLFRDGVGLSDDPDVLDEPAPYAVSPASGSSAPGASPGTARHSLRERWTAARERVRPWSAWPLRAKLVASMLALFTVLSLATGVSTIVALDRYLVGQVDDQLRQTLSPPRPDGDGRFRPPSSDDHGRGPGSEGLIAVIDPVAQGVATTSGNQTAALSTTQLAQLQGAGIGSDPTTIDLGGNVGEYRVMAARAPVQVNGIPTIGTVVVGLPTGPLNHTISRMILVAISAVVAGIVLVAVLGTWLVRRNLEPLRRLATTATKVSQTPLASGSVAIAERVDPADTDRRTEVGQVGAAFNEMLDHVDEALNARHQSEQRVRQFVADASHELRTPLASIKGYAELSRREPNAVPATVTHAMGRIESEADRMGSLVEDLLLLARLDAGRPLEEAPVDMSMLVINAVSDAHAASPGHHWDLDLPPEPVEVKGDGPRLHQVVTNLLANARTHTPDGTRVTTSVRPEGDWVRVAVHDDGPGVPESLQPNVFERFARGDDARNRAKGSTGLGLSIVAAVSKAHGGRVELDSRPGDTTFSLLLPAAS
ncbi:HAMP domain-containing sensor histidine kinase [Terrabacter sp. NPDC080008]|uniref:sensor histidine kinase n=1 Tax=Terrabacter sp. NPDC080008 TaxID=3155176 RepID=UPI00344DCE9B